MHTNTGRVTDFLDGEALRKSTLGNQRTLPGSFGNAYITRRHWLAPRGLRVSVLSQGKGTEPASTLAVLEGESPKVHGMFCLVEYSPDPG